MELKTSIHHNSSKLVSCLFRDSVLMIDARGLVGVGGFMPADFLPPVPEGAAQKAPFSPVVMTFGAEGFFGYAPSTSPVPSGTGRDDLAYDTVKPFGPEAMWWSTYSQETVSEKKDADDSLIRQQLLERHAKWKDPVIQKIIHGGIDIQSKTQTWVSPKLPTWARGGLILLGDAAHGKSTNDPTIVQCSKSR